MKFIRIFLIGLSLVAIGGCVSLPDSAKPYVRPEAQSSLEERKQIFQNKAAHASGGYNHVGLDETVWPPSNLQNYFEKSGASKAAGKMALSNLPVWLGFASGAAACWGLYSQKPVQGLGMVAFLGLTVLGQWASQHFYVDPASEDFNAYLRHDMGLPDDMPLEDPFALRADSRNPSGRYLVLSPGVTYLDGSDMAAFLRATPGSLDPAPGPVLSGDFLMGIGHVFESGLGYEIMLLLPVSSRSYSAHVNTGLTATDYDLDLSTMLYGVEFTPGFTFHFNFPGFAKKVTSRLGLGLGGAWVFADFSHSTYGAGTWFEEVQYRLSFPSNRRVAYGFELGYRHCKFDNFTSGGMFSPVTTLTNGQGQPASLDFSGPYLRLVMEVGTIPFTK